MGDNTDYPWEDMRSEEVSEPEAEILPTPRPRRTTSAMDRDDPLFSNFVNYQGVGYGLDYKRNWKVGAANRVCNACGTKRVWWRGVPRKDNPEQFKWTLFDPDGSEHDCSSEAYFTRKVESWLSRDRIPTVVQARADGWGETMVNAYIALAAEYGEATYRHIMQGGEAPPHGRKSRKTSKVPREKIPQMNPSEILCATCRSPIGETGECLCASLESS